MLAKRFLYVSAGILCLALAYHFGSGSATAQGPSAVRRLGDSWFQSGGAVYRAEGSSCETSGWVLELDLPPVPPSALISYDREVAVTETGEGWVKCPVIDGTWQSIGAIPGATVTERTSWGNVKARYRPNAPAAPQDK
jgi:hypothetical protein